MDKDKLKRGVIAEKVNNTVNEPLSTQNESESADVHEIIRKLDLQSIEENFVRGKKPNPDAWTINLNRNDYAAIIEGLNSNSTVTKIKILDKILGSQIVDTKQNLWGDLSQTLQKCFVSSNNDIFIKSLKIHHRMIAFPSTSTDGFLSLLKSTFLLLNSRLNDLNKNRILQTIHLISDSLNVVLKCLLHASHCVIDDVIAAFISVITFKSVFDWFGALDPQATWLKKICYGTYIRNAFFNHLKEKNPDFINDIAATFVKKLNEGCTCHGYFLLYFWRYENNLKFLPADSTLESILKFNQRTFACTQLIVNLFLDNPCLLTPKLLDILVEPLATISRTNVKNLVETNKHIFVIITNLAKSPNFRVLIGRRGRGRQIRNCASVVQKITDIIRMCLCLITGDSPTLLILLHCCVAIYDHCVCLTLVNPAKLLETLHEFYRLSWKNDVSVRGALLSLFKLFYCCYNPTLEILGCDNDVLHDLLTFTQIEDLRSVLCRIGRDKGGFEFVRSHRGQIVKPYLEKIWFSEDCDCTEFVLFLFVVKLSARSVVALLTDDDDDTVVESDRSVNLGDLIEKSLSGSSEADEEYLGLMAMKVLIINLDLLLYLQATYQLQEKINHDEKEIIDAQTCLRNNILHSLEFVGFVENKINQNFGEVAELKAVPQIFELLHLTSENEFRTFLETEANSGEGRWLAQARRVFKDSLDTFDPSLLVLLLERIPKTYVYRKVELQWPPSDCVYYQLHPEDFCGISLIITFGQKTGLLQLDDDSHNDNLTLLIKQSRALLSHQPDFFSNFDWFVGIVYLVCSGNFDQCKSILVNFINTQVTSLVWATFGKEFDKALQENFYLQFAVVLEENCTCFHALKMLGIAPDLFAQSWLTQCFFNCLKFEEICNFLAFSVLYPVECLLYYMVAIFQHLNDRICTITHSAQVAAILEMTELSDFRLSEHITLIEKLTKRYRNSHKL